ncbi:hypothetical protein Tco_0735611, partial [Tanacetum coccineum]
MNNVSIRSASVPLVTLISDSLILLKSRMDLHIHTTLKQRKVVCKVLGVSWNKFDLPWCKLACGRVSDQAKEIKLLKAKITKLKKKANPVIKHFKAYQKRISKEQRQQRKSLSKKKKVQIESVSKQGRKNAKGDGKAKQNAQSEGRTKEMMDKDKETDEVGLSTEEEVSTDFEKVSTDRPKLSTDDLEVSTDEQMES